MATVNKNDGILFYARYDMENDNGERVVGPTKRVARNGLDSVGIRVFQAAIDRMTHPDYSKDPFIDFGRGAKAPVAAVVETLPAVAHHPTGQSPSGGLDYGQHTNVVGALSAVAYHPTGQSPSGGLGYGGELHVDPSFHCLDGGVYNLLVSRYPDLAQKLKNHLTDDEFKRMDFKELTPWFHDEGVHLQSRWISVDDMLEDLRSKVNNEIDQLAIVATKGNTHCLAADTGRNELSDVATGRVVAITADDALTQLGEVGLENTGMVIELKQVRLQKRKGKKLSAAEKRRKADSN